MDKLKAVAGLIGEHAVTGVKALVDRYYTLPASARWFVRGGLAVGAAPYLWAVARFVWDVV
jgi:hypothetical protein